MWYIQKGIFGNHEDTKLKQALDNLGLGYSLCSIDGVTDSKVGFKDASQIVARFRGSVEFICIMKDKFALAFDKAPPNCVTPEAYDCSKYYIPWGKFMLNREHFFVTWGMLEQYGDQYFEWLDCDKLFIRPNSGYKIFTGNCITKRWCPQDLEIIKSLPNNSPSLEDLVMVARHKEICSEYRVMMHMDKAIGCSYYYGEEPDDSSPESKIKEYCEYAAKTANYYPDDYYTIDVAIMKDGYMKVLELNSLFSAGWYEADYLNIISHVEEYL